MSDRIPLLDLSPEIESLWDELHVAIDDVLRSGQFIMGETVRQFESEVAAYLGVNHAIGVNSGTDALVIALRALGVGPGDEVIVPSFTFFATAESVTLVGADPVFVDIDPVTLNLDPARVAQAITSRTKAIIPVHLFGQAAPMQDLLHLAETHYLVLLEDVAQAFGGAYRGEKVGTIGKISAFSFFPSKNLGAYGDAGLIATDDENLAEMARKLRTHGSLKKYHNEITGYNSRLDSLQAAILRVKLPRVDGWNQQRRDAAQHYNDLLADIEDVVTPQETPGTYHVYHQYTIRVLNSQRDMVKQALQTKHIATAIYYPVPLHRLPVYAHMDVKLPHTDHASAEVLSLPFGPAITPEQQQRVAEAIDAALTHAQA